MVVFNDNQFEIAIATYKRPEFIQSWLDKCYQDAVKRNISLSIYDSSPDNNTENVIESFNHGKNNKIDYHHVDSNTIIGYKAMFPILETKAEYLWVAGDSRYHHFEELDEKVFPYIKYKNVDYIVINVSNNYKLPDTVYEDKGKMLHDTFVASTCIGLSIYKMSMFDGLKKSFSLMQKCDDLFKNNYGFGWLGYFYYAYAAGEYKTLLANVETLPVLNVKKTQSWAVRFYGCWVDDLCQIIDNIPDSYIGKEDIPKNTWDVMKLDSFQYGHLARKYGDLNAEKFNQLYSDGMITRITDNPIRIKFFATAPLWIVETAYQSLKMIGLGYRAVKKIGKIIKGKNKR